MNILLEFFSFSIFSRLKLFYNLRKIASLRRDEFHFTNYVEKRERERKKDCNTEYNKAPKTPPSILEREFKRRTGLRKLFNPPCSSQVFDASFGVSAAIGYLRGCSYTRARAHSHTRGPTRKETSSIEILSNQKTAPPSRQNKYRAIFAMHTTISLSLSTLVFLFPQPPILRFSAFSPATKCTLVTRDHRARIRPSKYLQLKRNSAFAHARHV